MASTFPQHYPVKDKKNSPYFLTRNAASLQLGKTTSAPKHCKIFHDPTLVVVANNDNYQNLTV
jgi:hypothetical protein